MSEKMIQCAGRIEASKETKGLYFMRANTGKPMRLWNFDKPVVIDMQGATFAKEPTPILYYHDDWLPLGVTTEQKVSASAEPFQFGTRTLDEPGVFALWKITSSADFAREVQGNIENGFPYEVSIGARPIEMNEISKNEKVTVNGVEMQGPLAIATKSEIIEISVCVFGACPGTGNFKASRKVGETQASEMEGKEGKMETTLKNEPTTPAVEASQAGAGIVQNPAPVPTEAEIQAKQAQEMETERKKSIDMIAKFAKVEAGTRITLDEAEFKTVNAAKNYALKNGIAAEAFEKACIEASLSRSVGPVIHAASHVGSRSNVLQASALLAVGIPGEWLTSEKGGYSAAEVEAADREQSRVGFIPMMGEALQAAGRPVDYLNTHQIIRDFRALQASGTVTTDFGSTNIFSPILDKKMRYQYELYESIWKRLYQKRTVRDFKEVATVDWEISGSGKTLIEDEDYPTVKITSDGEKFGTEKQGIVAAISWEMQVNDDMGALGTLGNKLVEILYDEQCEAFWTDFWSNFSTKYNTSPAKNKTNKPLTASNLSVAKKLFRALKDANGRFVKAAPKFLLVPPALEDVADAIFQWVWAGENNTKYNNHIGKYQVICDPNLGADSNFTSQGASDTGWFMIGDPGRYPLGEYAVLNGFATPRIVETWYDHKDGLNIRAKGTVGFHGYTSKLAAVYSDGTNS